MKDGCKEQVGERFDEYKNNMAGVVGWNEMVILKTSIDNCGMKEDQ